MGKFKLRPKYWKEDIKNEFNIIYIENIKQLKEVMKKGVLWTSRCSKQKSDKDKVTPREFYIGPINLLFYNYMEKYNLKYGILSDFYGLLYQTDIIDYYDVHPSQINDKIKQKLGNIIKDKVLHFGYDTIIFFNSSPVMSKPYFEMLYYSGITVYYISDIKLLDKLKYERTQLKLF